VKWNPSTVPSGLILQTNLVNNEITFAAEGFYLITSKSWYPFRGAWGGMPEVDTSELPSFEQSANMLRRKAQECWNGGFLGSEALGASIRVGILLNEDGTVIRDSIQILGQSGSEEGVNQLFEATFRSIVRCGATGFSLPIEEYEEWKRVELSVSANSVAVAAPGDGEVKLILSSENRDRYLDLAQESELAFRLETVTCVRPPSVLVQDGSEWKREDSPPCPDAIIWPRLDFIERAQLAIFLMDRGVERNSILQTSSK
jgi:hypothetical protein